MNSPLQLRLKKNQARLKNMVSSQNLSAYRLYDKDIPEYPFIIDVYNEYVVVYEKGNLYVDELIRDKHIKECLEALLSLNFSLDNTFFKTRTPQTREDRQQKIDVRSISTFVTEKSLKFEVNLSDYLDTGLFFDHRPLRSWLTKQNLKEKNVLNLFAYTCSLGIAAAKAGAETTNVDLSTTYLDWGRRNYELNEINLTRHDFIRTDILDWLKGEQKVKFDLIILDPPTFSNSKMMDETLDIVRDQEFLIERCMAILEKEGLLIFSTNKKGFKIADSIGKNFKVIDKTIGSIPEDIRNEKARMLFHISHL